MTDAQQIAIAVIEQQGKVLVGRREEGSHLAGCWEFPGGKVEPGETPAEAAVREAREETGLRVEIRGLYARVEHAYDRGLLCLHFFACSPRPSGDAAPPDQQAAEQTPKQPFRWLPVESLEELEFPPANRAALHALAAGATPQPVEPSR